MKAVAALLALSLVAMPAAIKEWLRSSNSRASTDRGIEEYDAKKHAEAAKSFSAAEEIEPGPLARYNLGTARVAAGQGTRAAADFTDALTDDALAADAYFNRGSGAMQSGAWDDAIGDFSEALRRAPSDPDAKRNLEIALKKKAIEEEKKKQQQKQQQSQGNEKQQEKNDAGKPGPDGELDVESVLRSVEQQEQEELSRMRRPTSTRGRNW
ncbi:MAG: tetratricopeptide repeat protein [Thermoanaerobaculia bacterium]